MPHEREPAPAPLRWGLPRPDPALERAVGRALFEWALDPMMLTRPGDGAILDANPAACRVLGYPVEEIRALGREGLRDPADARWVHGLQERARTGSFVGELGMVRKDGAAFPAEVSSAVFQVDGQEYAVLVFRDVSARYRLERDLREALSDMARLATVDDLTGLLNRRGFMTAGQTLVEQALRRRAPLVLLLGDVDGLKQANDRYGHAVGDDMLRDVAAVLTETLRAADVVARIGGDEFAVVLTGTDAVEGAAVAVERVGHALTAYAEEHRRPYWLAMSIGVAAGDATASLERLLRRADEELYRVKSHRRVEGRR